MQHRTPAAERQLTGVHLERLNKLEARFERLQSLPQVKSLDEAGREVFDEVGPELLANGLLTRASLKLFVMYCAACAEWEHAALDVQQNGRWLETEVFNTKGDLVGHKRIPNPMLVEMRHSANAARLLAMEFGLTPATAARVVAAPRDDKPAKKSLRDFVTGPTESPEQVM